ncbi:hypothetical protein FD52_15220, partial [Staphylococcus aureus]
LGFAPNLEEANGGVVFLGPKPGDSEGGGGKRTGGIMGVTGGGRIIGRGVKPLGETIVGQGPIKTT